MLKSYNREIHVITWDEFDAVFGQRSIPRHWTRYGAHDWSATRSDYHACVADFLAVSAQDSALPGAFFLYESMSFAEGTQADDVAMRIVKSVAPHVAWDSLLGNEIVRAQLEEAAHEKDMTRAIERRRQVVASDFPPPVGITTNVSRPSRITLITSRYPSRNPRSRNVHGAPRAPLH